MKPSILPPMSRQGRDDDEATIHPVLDESHPFSAHFRNESIGYRCFFFLFLNLKLSKFKNYTYTVQEPILKTIIPNFRNT
jgi:hypothetical protein